MEDNEFVPIPVACGTLRCNEKTLRKYRTRAATPQQVVQGAVYIDLGQLVSWCQEQRPELVPTDWRAVAAEQMALHAVRHQEPINRPVPEIPAVPEQKTTLPTLPNGGGGAVPAAELAEIRTLVNQLVSGQNALVVRRQSELTEQVRREALAEAARAEAHRVRWPLAVMVALTVAALGGAGVLAWQVGQWQQRANDRAATISQQAGQLETLAATRATLQQELAAAQARLEELATALEGQRSASQEQQIAWQAAQRELAGQVATLATALEGLTKQSDPNGMTDNLEKVLPPATGGDKIGGSITVTDDAHETPLTGSAKDGH